MAKVANNWASEASPHVTKTRTGPDPPTDPTKYAKNSRGHMGAHGHHGHWVLGIIWARKISGGDRWRDHKWKYQSQLGILAGISLCKKYCIIFRVTLCTNVLLQDLKEESCFSIFYYQAIKVCK